MRKFEQLVLPEFEELMGRPFRVAQASTDGMFVRSVERHPNGLDKIRIRRYNRSTRRNGVGGLTHPD